MRPRVTKPVRHQKTDTYTVPVEPPTGGGGTAVSLVRGHGAFARLSSNSTSTTDGSGPIGWHLDNPQAEIVSMMIKWYLWETAKGVFDTTITNNVRAITNDAHTNGYKLVIRPLCGADSPIGRPGTSRVDWLATHPTLPVGRIRTFNNESSADTEEIFIPNWIDPASYANYRTHYVDMLHFTNAVLDEPCPLDTSHTRATHVILIPAALPTESGSEMTLGYGTLATYSGAATVANITAGATSITLAGTASGYGPGLWKITNASSPLGYELIHVSAFNTSTKVATVARRGHSGTGTTNAGGTEFAVGASAAAVKYASSGTITATFNGYTGPYDHGAQNRRQWHDATGASGATFADREVDRQNKTKQAWLDCIADHIEWISPLGLRTGMAGGHLFNDGWARADSVIQTVGALYGPKVMAMTTSLKANYASTNPNDDDYLKKGKAAGCTVACQTAGSSAFSSVQNMVDACEYALTTYGINFLETYTGAFTSSTSQATSATGGWPGGTVTMKQYLLTHASNLQDRLPID